MELLVTKIEPFGQKRRQIFFEDGEPVVLYIGECRKYEIKEGQDFSEEDYQELLTEVLYKRARERMLYLLDSMDRTESQVREKLRQGGYPSACIEQVISFGRKYRYLDDERYIKNYYHLKKRKKSYRKIEQDLVGKGISKDFIKEKLKEEAEMTDEEGMSGKDFEEEQICRFFEKRKQRILSSEDSQREWQKAFQSLYQKGFSYEKICEIKDSLKREWESFC